MATLTLRATKGSALTHDEVDDNFSNLNTDKLESGDVAAVALSGDYGDLDNIPSTFTPAAHGHVIADVTGLQAALDGKQATGSYANTTHTHVIADVTGLQAALDGKQVAGSYQPLATVLTNTTASFTTAQETKLAGIASGATANSSDATLLSRANHTDKQLLSTISDFYGTSAMVGAGHFSN